MKLPAKDDLSSAGRRLEPTFEATGYAAEDFMDALQTHFDDLTTVVEMAETWGVSAEDRDAWLSVASQETAADVKEHLADAASAEQISEGFFYAQLVTVAIEFAGQLPDFENVKVEAYKTILSAPPKHLVAWAATYKADALDAQQVMSELALRSKTGATPWDNDDYRLAHARFAENCTKYWLCQKRLDLERA